MLIDWFTVAAQALNFVVLVWLMKRFLYKPILDAVEAREGRIASELASATAAKTEAQTQSEEFGRKNAEFEGQRADLLEKATKAAAAANQQLLDAGKKAADAVALSRQESLEASIKTLNVAIARKAQDEVFSIARKALADLSAATLEARIAGVFIDRLNTLDSATKQTLDTAIRASSGPAIVRSAFDLPSPEQLSIKTAINVAFSADVPLRFETAPDLIGGIEISANGQKLAWSIDAYLTSLESGVGALVDPSAKPASPTLAATPTPEAAAKAQ